MVNFDTNRLTETPVPQPGRKSNAADNAYYILRQAHGYSFSQLAKLTHACVHTLRRLEHGRNARFCVIKELAELYGVTMDELVRNDLSAVKTSANCVHAVHSAKHKCRSASQIETGELGEMLAADFERERLAGTGYECRVSTEPAKNRRNGYDVISVTSNGQPKYIEVKATTSQDPLEPFHMSGGELRKARQMAESGANYELFRIYALDRKAETYEYVVYSAADVVSLFDPEPESYLMHWKED